MFSISKKGDALGAERGLQHRRFFLALLVCGLLVSPASRAALASRCHFAGGPPQCLLLHTPPIIIKNASSRKALALRVVARVGL